MNLSSPITIQPPTIHGNTPPSFIIDSLNIVLVDNSTYKTVCAQLLIGARHMVLWGNEDYDNIGDYTQAQAEARIIELLGDDPKSVLESLYPVPKLNSND